ncbi:hypothetical protein [Paenibacillus oralis]|nr:hypothetical protein [Paenibacillus oralis]
MVSMRGAAAVHTVTSANLSAKKSLAAARRTDLASVGRLSAPCSSLPGSP